MATPIRIKRRGSGAPGAPASLQNAELAYNEVDDVLYYGKGTGGAGGTATTIPAIAGKGAFVDLTSAQTVSGLKTFSVLPQSTVTPTNDDDFTTREWVLSQIGSSGGGTVTSVGVAAPAGFDVAGSPITSAGTITLSYSTGYQGFTTAEASKLANAASTDVVTTTTNGLMIAADKVKLNGIAAGATANVGTVTSVAVSAPTGFSVTGSPITNAGTVSISYSTGYQGYTTVEANKLDGVQSGATANQTDAYLLARGNHTGTQTIATVSGLQAALDSKVATALLGVPDGVATLDAGGKIPESQLPNSVIGGLSYQGTWDASTNTPAIPAAAPANDGHYYIVAVAGTTPIDGIDDWEISDWVISNGVTWSKIDNTNAVTSVNGKLGTVVIDVADLASAGTMATQNASAVAITGGTIDGVTLDGGTF